MSHKKDQLLRSGRRYTHPLSGALQKDVNHIDFDSGFCSADVCLLGDTWGPPTHFKQTPKKEQSPHNGFQLPLGELNQWLIWYLFIISHASYPIPSSEHENLSAWLLRIFQFKKKKRRKITITTKTTYNYIYHRVSGPLQEKSDVGSDQQ